MNDKRLVVLFNSNEEPQFEFSGAWNIRDLGRTRSTIFRAYKHYIREVRAQLKEEVR